MLIPKKFDLCQSWRKCFCLSSSMAKRTNIITKKKDSNYCTVQFSSVTQSCPTLRPHEPQASLSITNSWSLPNLMPVESVMPSSHLILCHPLLLPSIFLSIRVFSNESALHIKLLEFGGQSIGVSASTSVLPVNTRTDIL